MIVGKIDLKSKVSANSTAEAFSVMMGGGRKGDIQQLPISSLVPYEGQPFKPYTKERLFALAEDIRDNGIINPIIVRQISEDKYQILAGHNRVNACKLLEMEEVPSIIKGVDDNQAALIMLNSNLNQRDELRPSEKAFAYKMQAEVRKAAARTNGPSVSVVADENNVNLKEVYRYIRLTFLIPAFLDRVDNAELPFRAGVNLSYLTERQQDKLLDYVDTYNLKISLEQSEKLKDAAKISEPEGILLCKLDEVFGRTPKEKTPPSPIGKAFKAVAGREELATFFEGKSKKEIEEIVIKALELYYTAKNDKEGES